MICLVFNLSSCGCLFSFFGGVSWVLVCLIWLFVVVVVCSVCFGVEFLPAICFSLHFVVMLVMYQQK